MIACLQEIIGQRLPPEIIRYYKRIRLFELKVLYGMEAIDLDVEVQLYDIANISHLIDTIIPISLCREHEIIPFRRTDTSLLVGMVAPTNFTAVDRVSAILRYSNLRLQRRVMLREDFEQIFDHLIEVLISQSTDSEDDSNAPLEGETIAHSDSEPDLAQLLARTPVPIAQLADRILAIALQQEASEIMIEPQANYLNVRLRVDGRLQAIQPQLPPHLASTLTNRLKLIANLDITKRQTPQIGKLNRVFKNRRVSFQVSTLAVSGGENIAIQVLDPARLRRSLVRLKLPPSIYPRLEPLCDRTSGLTLVVGGANSGISTTLFALLERYSQLTRTVISIENPIELPLSQLAIAQVEANTTQDIVDAVRSVQQQNPEVIALSAISSPEIAEILFDAASRSAILTSLPVDHSVTALGQLLFMRISPTILSARLNAIIYQKLLRRVCHLCRIPYRPEPDELERSGFLPDAASHTFCRAHVVSSSALNAGQICSKCQGTGYHGSVVACEIMPITENLRVAIARGVPPTRIRQMAIAEGMITLLESSHNLARQGYTTLEEVARLVASNALLEQEKEVKLGRVAPRVDESETSASANPQPEEMLMGMIETLDLFDFANRQTQPQTQRERTIHDSYQRLRDRLFQVLQSAGVTTMETIGQPFDPTRHEAMTTSPTTQHPADTVIDEFRRGYMLGDRVLRHAQVEVAVAD